MSQNPRPVTQEAKEQKPGLEEGLGWKLRPVVSASSPGRLRERENSGPRQARWFTSVSRDCVPLTCVAEDNQDEQGSEQGESSSTSHGDSPQGLEGGDKKSCYGTRSDSQLSQKPGAKSKGPQKT